MERGKTIHRALLKSETCRLRNRKESHVRVFSFKDLREEEAVLEMGPLRRRGSFRMEDA